MSQVKILNDRLLPDITNIIINFNMPTKEDIKYLDELKDVIILSECWIYDFSRNYFTGRLKVSQLLLKNAKDIKKYGFRRYGKRRKHKEKFRISNIDEYMKFKYEKPLIYSKHI